SEITVAGMPPEELRPSRARKLAPHPKAHGLYRIGAKGIGMQYQKRILADGTEPYRFPIRHDRRQVRAEHRAGRATLEVITTNYLDPPAQRDSTGHAAHRRGHD